MSPGITAVAEDDFRLEARNVGFSYTRPLILNLNLGLSSRIVTGLIGPNGCGKTTVLRLLDGILRPQQGEVLVNGSLPLARMTRKQIARSIAVVPQNGGFYHYETVFGFTMQGRSPHLSLLGFESDRDEGIVRRALEMTRLEDHLDKRVPDLSGGERQRLLMARALAQEPETLLLDEFTANLDINYQVELMRLVRRITRERNLATLVVSHEINLLASFCDRIVLMAAGRIIRHGTVKEVVTRENLRELFGLDFQVRSAATGTPEVLPVLNDRKS
jgi:iron complex transport system ATP-binding protein